jgi:hypothetical protein
MPISSRFMPLATLLVFGLAVGGVSQNVVAGVGVVVAIVGIVRFGAGKVLPLAAAGALLGGIGMATPRDAEARTVTLRAIPGGYALADRDGAVLYRAEGLGAKRACLHRAAADGALRVVA